MRAYVLPAFGAADAFEARDIPMPEPGPNEVRVRVHATSVNPLDARVRAEGEGLVELPAVLGYDVSGVVDAVGAGVERFDPGDEVFYTPELFEQGSYAEYHVERADIVAHKPPSLSHEEAASLPVVACTAWEALVDRAGVRLGETVLVHGGGGVGSQAVQIAAAAGARVVCTTGPASVDLVADLGADRAIDYRETDFVEALADDPDGMDVVFSTVGGDALERSVEVMNETGRIVDVVGEAGDVGGPAKLKNVAVDFMALTRRAETLESVARLVARGQLEPVIDSVHPLSEVGAAHRKLEAGGLQGKLVLTVDE
ncbi:zinc-binding dehydrogenase [Haloglomus litoreum]|uniref:zinc-binding dehydrogenase n=1 Tax=Haloglomus litoreum TaxID=3034026 RepID=UPI0023E8D6AE|nr:zinc-binding dehydrogenase [Haloglomus sp. DT116]